MKKKTMVFGASPNPQRYAHIAANRLLDHGHEIELVGRRSGEVRGNQIQTDWPKLSDIDTISLYMGPQNQPEFYNYLLGHQPRRIIFNPGTENSELVSKANAQGIETEYACTLVLLAAGMY